MTSTDFASGRLATGLLVFTALFVLTQLYLAIPLAGPVAADLGGAGADFALATVFSLFYAVGFLIWGPVSDHWGRKRVMAPGVIVLAVATVACAAAPNLGWLAVLRGAQGVVASSFAPIALAWLTEALPPQRRATAIGAMSTAFLVAGIFGQVLASAVALWLDWRWVFIITGVTLLGAGVLIWLIVDEPVNDRPPAHLGQRFAGLLKLAAQPRIMLLCCAHITLLLSFVAMYSALGPHLAGLGFDPSGIIALRMVGLPGMFAALSVGWLATQIGMAGVARAGFLMAAAGLATEAALANTLAGIAFGSLIFVTGVALAVPSMITLFGTAAAPNRAGGMSLNGFVLFIGASIGPLAASAASGFQILLILLAFALSMAALCVLAFARIQHRMSPPA
ncbi:MFS transporter [Pseudochelatococcus contaminans]|uniref:Putative MFS family arabinose efflux permease n=1 Tax=Pseudochelatococcus contaminans TaxID=1538103 RepID=A0A7W5Z425_9HYPH|nr:MFS transporter [Pseudochelatococcus contaminans]MBB3809727.1 putative MFS family arabinose efflux permease [Pseudochelatococcus contaminans]